MGYSIHIGNAVAAVDDGGAVGVTVQGVNLDSAPVLPNDAMTGTSNGRFPSYSTWEAFCDVTGLRHLFFAKDTGLMCKHPGCMKLTRAHLDAVRNARAGWEAAHPGAVPGFGHRAMLEDEIKEKEDFGQGIDDTRALLAALPPSGAWDDVLARLIWLDFWMTWALASCEMPAICNR